MSWNTGGNGGQCDLWSKTDDGNSRYITSASNGQGLQQTFLWQNARNNTHRTASPADPFYCNTHQAGYPCDEADDQAWSRIVLTERDDTVQQITQAGQGGTQTTIPVTSRYVYTYLTTYPLAAQECGDCVSGMYWGNQNDGDYLDAYNGHFMGFAQTTVSKPDGSRETHTFYSTEGWGVYDTGVGKVTSCPSNLPPVNITCHKAPWWDLTNAAHGHETEVDSYDTNGTTLLKKTTAAYSVMCPPAGVSGSTNGVWDGQLVSELDVNNPVAVCDVEQTQQVTTTSDGGANSITATTTTTYGSYGLPTQTTSVSSSGTPGTIVHTTAYVWNDGVTATSTGATGTYLIGLVGSTNTEDGHGNRVDCNWHHFDGAAYVSGQTSTLKYGTGTESDHYTNCGTAPNYAPTGFLGVTAGFDKYGNQQGATDQNGNAGCTAADGKQYTTCKGYDPASQAKSTGQTNTKGQASYVGYTATAPGGYGLWPTASTDTNNQQTSVNYDALGRMTSIIRQPDTAATPTAAMAYTNWCASMGAQTPCVEQDVTPRLDSATTATIRTFTDGLGRAIETRSPLTSSQDVVTYTLYEAAGHATSSVKYLVAAYTGAAGQAAFSLPDSAIATSTATTDGLGRSLSATDALSDTTHVGYTINCAVVTGDSACYEQTAQVDANSHQQARFIDGFGRTIYTQRFTGTNPYAIYTTLKETYDTLGHVVVMQYPDGTHTATATYDAAGRMTASSDPDLGSYTYWHDANNNVSIIADPRGAAGTIYLCYDGLNRLIKKPVPNDCSSTNTTATYTYDSGTNGTGHETGETFTSNGVSGSYAYAYDARGHMTNWTMTLGSTNYPFTLSYNDAGLALTVQYPDGDTLTGSYTAQGLFAGMSEQINTTTNQLLNGITYGANGPTGASVGNGTSAWSVGHDTLGRTTSIQAALTGGATQFSQTRSYDAVGNVLTAQATLPSGTDNQAYCYDEQNRLTWAGSTGSAPCQTLTAGTLTAANYQQSYAYDTLNRLTQGPLGAGYAYGDTSHLDALTIAPGYSASYDTAGDMTSRNSQSMMYDTMRRLLTWQNTASNPTSTASYAYDGEGVRVQQTVTTSGTATTTQYIGKYEEISTTGGTTTTTKYYDAGLIKVTNVNGTLNYLVNDGLGSVSGALDASGNLNSAQLFSPYGATRYSSGTMPTSYGFTGQRGDPSGLIYMHARYYDGTAGTFISADTVQGPNRYGYVAGNPTTLTDPTGQMAACGGAAMEDGVCHRYHAPKPKVDCHKTNSCVDNSNTPTPAGIARASQLLVDLETHLNWIAAIALAVGTAVAIIFTLLIGTIITLIAGFFTAPVGIALQLLTFPFQVAIGIISLAILAIGTTVLVLSSQIVVDLTNQQDQTKKWTVSALQAENTKIDNELWAVESAFVSLVAGIGVLAAFLSAFPTSIAIFLSDALSTGIMDVTFSNVAFTIDNSFGAAESAIRNIN